MPKSNIVVDVINGPGGRIRHWTRLGLRLAGQDAVVSQAITNRGHAPALYLGLFVDVAATRIRLAGKCERLLSVMYMGACRSCVNY